MKENVVVVVGLNLEVQQCHKCVTGQFYHLYRRLLRICLLSLGVDPKNGRDFVEDLYYKLAVLINSMGISHRLKRKIV